MLADFFTKPLQGGLFKEFRDLILNTNASCCPKDHQDPRSCGNVLSALSKWTAASIDQARIYRKFATGLDNCPADEEIRMKTCGWTRPIYTNGYFLVKWKRFTFKKKRNKEMYRIVKKVERLHESLESPEKIMQAKEVSHCLVRYWGYTRCHYRLTCKEVLDVFSKKLAKLGVKSVIKHLIAVSEGDFRGEDTFKMCMEQIFKLHTPTVIQWKQCQMQLN